MKLHTRCRKGATVRIKLRNGVVYFWTFECEHNAWIQCREGTLAKRMIRSMTPQRSRNDEAHTEIKEPAHEAPMVSPV